MPPRSPGNRKGVRQAAAEGISLVLAHVIATLIATQLCEASGDAVPCQDGACCSRASGRDASRRGMAPDRRALGERSLGRSAVAVRRGKPAAGTRGIVDEVQYETRRGGQTDTSGGLHGASASVARPPCTAPKGQARGTPVTWCRCGTPMPEAVDADGTSLWL